MGIDASGGAFPEGNADSPFSESRRRTLDEVIRDKNTRTLREALDRNKRERREDTGDLRSLRERVLDRLFTDLDAKYTDRIRDAIGDIHRMGYDSNVLKWFISTTSPALRGVAHFYDEEVQTRQNRMEKVRYPFSGYLPNRYAEMNMRRAEMRRDFENMVDIANFVRDGMSDSEFEDYMTNYHAAPLRSRGRRRWGFSAREKQMLRRVLGRGSTPDPNSDEVRYPTTDQETFWPNREPE